MPLTASGLWTPSATVEEPTEPLTDAEIEERFGDSIQEFIAAVVVDPLMLVEIVEDANKYERQRQVGQTAAATRAARRAERSAAVVERAVPGEGWSDPVAATTKGERKRENNRRHYHRHRERQRQRAVEYQRRRRAELAKDPEALERERVKQRAYNRAYKARKKLARSGADTRREGQVPTGSRPGADDLNRIDR